MGYNPPMFKGDYLKELEQRVQGSGRLSAGERTMLIEAKAWMERHPGTHMAEALLAVYKARKAGRSK